MLVKNALTAVNHGNLTGNYTVLRDLGAPAFRERNSAAQLAAIFQSLRDNKIDMSPILLMNPQFTEQPALNQAGQLQLVGFFPTAPAQVNFKLAFQKVQNGWLIDTVSISTTAAQGRSRMRVYRRPRPRQPRRRRLPHSFRSNTPGSERWPVGRWALIACGPGSRTTSTLSF